VSALAATTAALRAAGFENPAFEARLLVAHALGVPHSDLIALTREPDPATLAPLLARRLAHEPMALIMGHQGFWTLDFEVSPATLIPRPDSETLIEAALANCPAPRRILDLGTGTGCLLLAALSEYPDAWGLGIDLIPAAAALAARNARRNALDHRATFLAGNWTNAIDATFDLVLSNPPYIPSADIPALMPEVAAHEPGSALDGGPDGLDAYRTLLARLPALLAPDGTAILELGIGQSEPVAALAEAAGFPPPDLRHDLGGIARAIILKKSFGVRPPRR
jgi:release factor glutamine methyltransferase